MLELNKSHELYGFFWNPDTPTTRIPGVLTYEPNSGVWLHLWSEPLIDASNRECINYDLKPIMLSPGVSGSFPGKNEVLPVLHGTANGYQVELIQVVTNNCSPFVSLYSQKRLYVNQVILFRGAINFETQKQLKSIEFSLSDINNWSGLSSGKVFFDDTKNSVTYETGIKDSKKFTLKIRSGEKLLINVFSKIEDAFGIGSCFQSEQIIDFKLENISLNEFSPIHSQITDRFILLLYILNLKPISFSRLELAFEQENNTLRSDFLIKQNKVTYSEKENYRFPIVSLAVIENDIQQLWDNWQTNIPEETGWLFRVTINDIWENGWYPRRHFLDTLQIIDTLNPTSNHNHHSKERMKYVLTNLDSKIKLKFGLISQTIVDDLLTIINDTRNYYVHYSPKSNAIKESDGYKFLDFSKSIFMLVYSYFLQLILPANLLPDIPNYLENSWIQLIPFTDTNGVLKY